MSVFGVIASGRLPQTDCVEISPGKYLMTIQDADAINHLVVFLTGITALPVGKSIVVLLIRHSSNQLSFWQTWEAVSTFLGQIQTHPKLGSILDLYPTISQVQYSV